MNECIYIYTDAAYVWLIWGALVSRGPVVVTMFQNSISVQGLDLLILPDTA